MRRPRILLADAQRLLREALTALLMPGCDVVGAVADVTALLELAPELRPDIIVLDLAGPRLSGLDAVREVQERLPGTRLIVLTARADPDLAAAAFRAGASGYLVKDSAAAELFHAIGEVFQGRSYVTPLLGAGPDGPLFAASGEERPGGLSPRQREVLQLLAEGRSMKEAARILKVTPRTVAFHKYNMMDQLGIRTSAELIQYAVRRRIVPV
jgi:DNA-binding NarL/FixJ family response regulator